MHSRMLNKRRDLALEIEAAAVEQGGEVVEQAARLLSEDLREGEKLPDLGQLVELLRRRVGRQASTLLQADTVEKEVQSVRLLTRLRRNQAALRVRDLLVAFRTVVDKAQGPGVAVATYDLAKTRSRNAVELLAKAERVQQRLVNESFQSVDAAVPVPFDPASWLTAFAEPVAELTQAISEFKHVRRREDQRAVTRRAQLAAFDVAVKDGVKLLAAVFTFGRHPELARKLQLGRRRPAVASGPGGGSVDSPVPVPAAPAGLVEPAALLPEEPPQA